MVPKRNFKAGRKLSFANEHEQKEQFLSGRKITCNLKLLETSGNMQKLKPDVNPFQVSPAGNHMFKINNRNTRKRCEMFKVNNKDTRTTAMASFWDLY